MDEHKADVAHPGAGLGHARKSPNERAGPKSGTIAEKLAASHGEGTRPVRRFSSFLSLALFSLFLPPSASSTTSFVSRTPLPRRSWTRRAQKTLSLTLPLSSLPAGRPRLGLLSAPVVRGTREGMLVGRGRRRLSLENVKFCAALSVSRGPSERRGALSREG